MSRMTSKEAFAQKWASCSFCLFSACSAGLCLLCVNTSVPII